MTNYRDSYEEWLNSEVFDSDTKEKITSLSTDDEIRYYFSNELKFGTGGIRATMDVGTSHMNIYTILRITQGVANYLNSIPSTNGANKSVIICYDSRNNSKEFALATASCFAHNNISTYIFEALRPTPELSFAIRQLRCDAGINITASHNPPEYNGYKVYGSDGVQIINTVAQLISEEINKITDYSFIKDIDLNNHNYQILSPSFDKYFIDAIKKIIINSEIIKELANTIKIVYTPLFGSGITLVPDTLREIGFKNIYVVTEQEKPNGNFPRLSTPNPECTDSFELALNLARKVNADIVFATDPDADRFGVYAWCNQEQDYIHFTGNMIGSLICEYELAMQHNNKKKNVVYRTLVSSKMGIDICNYYNAICKESFTGFKNIGKQMEYISNSQNEYSDGSYNFVMGYEESYGCVIGNYTRDKDSIGSIAVVCEMLAYYKKQNLSLWQQLNNLYKRYGYFFETSFSFVFDSLTYKEKTKAIMDYLRNTHDYQLDSFKFNTAIDYYIGTIYSFNECTLNTFLHSKSNVLYFDFTDNSWACIRPSGTEPKLKIYVGTKKNTYKDAVDTANLLINEFSKLIEAEL